MKTTIGVLTTMAILSMQGAEPAAVNSGDTAASWWNQRRPAILQTYENLMYGALPPRADAVDFVVVSEKKDALDGRAIRREVTIRCRQGEKTFEFPVLWYLPAGKTSGVPCIVALNFCGNSGTTPETDIAQDEPGKARGWQASRWPFGKLIDAGFSVMTAPRNRIFPDRADGRRDSIWQLFYPAERLTEENRDLTAISGWAGGYRLMLELAETEPAIDRRRIWAHGHSRLGKTALWAAANELRFAGTVSNDSGCCGASLFRGQTGENIAYITKTFPWWFQKALDAYADREKELPLDQHFLIGLIAPRPVLIASASEDAWASPEYEFRAACAAGEVYRLFGAKGMPADAVFPAPDHSVFGDCVGYYLRAGKHDVTDMDWKFVLEFINRNR